MAEKVTFSSDVELVGQIFRPAATATEARRPGVVLCHGFAGTINTEVAVALADRGITVLAFAFRGFGASAGERGNVICSEQVADAKAAVDYLISLPDVDPSRIGVVGSSLGGSIVLLETAEDSRVAALAVACPVANGERFLEQLHRDNDGVGKAPVAAARLANQGGKLHRFEIVPIPEHLRHALPKDTPMEFTQATLASIRDLDVQQAVEKIAPRPLLLLHAFDDSVVPKSESDSLAARAVGHCEYRELDAGDHFILVRPEVVEIVSEWLSKALRQPKLGSPARKLEAADESK